MDAKLRIAMPTRFTALGFIILILGGNGWFGYYVFGAKVPEIIRMVFMLGLVMSILGGIGMVVWKIKQILYPSIGAIGDNSELEIEGDPQGPDL